MPARDVCRATWYTDCVSLRSAVPLKDAIEAEGKGNKYGKDYLTTDADVLQC